MLHYVDRLGHTEIDFGIIHEHNTKEGEYYASAQRRAEDLEIIQSRHEHEGKLTKEGIKEKLTERFKISAQANFQDAREIERQLAESEGVAATLALSGVPKLDSTDAAGALADRELRDFWRGLNNDQRADLHNQMIAGEHADLAIALLRGSPVVVGLLPARRAAMQDAMIRPEQREQLESVRGKIDRLNRAKYALAACNQAMSMRVGLTPSEARKVLGMPSLIEAFKAENSLS